MHTATGLALVALCCVTLGCSGDPAQDIASEHVWEQRFHAVPTEPNQFVLLVDDSTSATADSLRKAVIAQLRRSFTSLLDASAASDPAGATPFDLSVVLVFPSRSPDIRIVGPSDDAGLAIRSNAPSAADVEALVSRTEALLNSSLSDATQSYQPLEAITTAATLVHRERSPNSASEQALVDALDRPGDRRIEWVVASTRDDDSPESPAEYLLSLGEQEWGTSHLVALVESGEVSNCSGSAVLPSSRLLTWASAADDSYTVIRPASCLTSEPDLELGFLFSSIAQRFSWCTSKPIALHANGQPQCRVFVNTDDCDPERGWAQLADGSCEVVQLEGDALRACQTDLNCEGCVSGWCRSEPMEPLESDHVCGSLEHPTRLRFPGTSVVGTGASFDISCALETGD